MLIAYTSSAEHIALQLEKKGQSVIHLKKNKDGKLGFPDGEKYVAIVKNKTPGKDVLVLHSRHLEKDPNADYAEFLMLLGCLKENGYNTKYAFFLVAPYQRQDNVFEEGEFNAAKAVIDDLVENRGVQTVFAVDPHFLNKGWAKEYAEGRMLVPIGVSKIVDNFVEEKFGNGIATIGPDEGASERFGIDSFSKKRVDSNTIEMSAGKMKLEVKGKTIRIHDDIISTGGTMAKAIENVKKKGAAKVIATAVHGTILEGVERVAAVADEIAVTNTIKTKHSKIDITDAVEKVLTELGSSKLLESEDSKMEELK